MPLTNECPESKHVLHQVDGNNSLRSSHLAAVFLKGCSNIITLLEFQEGQVKQLR